MKSLESGRSMVEMLGVMAIVGVLSIAGLYGYTKAMGKYHANELLNEASKRAVLVAGQLMEGKSHDEGIFKDFPSNPYGKFVNSIEEVGDKFKLKISDLEEDICKLMADMVGGAIRRLDCVAGEGDSFTAEMTFNKDLSTKEKASDYNGRREECENKEEYKYCENTERCVMRQEECPQPAVNCSSYQGAGLADEEVYVGDLAGYATDGETECRCKVKEKYEDGKCMCKEILSCGVWGNWNETTCKCDCDEGWYGKSCDSDCNGIKVESGGYVCRSCDYEYFHSALTNVIDCSACDESPYPRKIFSYKGVDYCSLVECPFGYFRIDTNTGGCIGCGTNHVEPEKTTSTDCSACDGTDHPRIMCYVEGKRACVREVDSWLLCDY